MTELRPRPFWALDPECPRADRYLLGPELGRGGMGRVCLGWDDLLRRTVAIKLLLGDDPEWHVRLLREAQNQAKLVHPCICQIYDVGQAGDRPYIAMQLVHGLSLSELRPQLSRNDLVRIMADVASALHEAHQAGLIHRDLKPMNILVEGQPGELLKPFVVDFGLARDLRAPDLTLSWAVMGTPAFMSPEQARGESLAPTSDIYSLGATLYSLLVGAPPYEGTTLGGILAQQNGAAVRPLRRHDSLIPRDLETITLKCLEHDPSRRYSTAFEVEEDLRRWLAGEPILARPVGPLGRLQRWVNRKPALAGTIAVGLLISLGLLGWNNHIRSTAKIRESAAQRFGMEIRDAEHLLRIERMLPIHDIRPAEKRLRTRMEAIQKEMAQFRSIALGPGYYAIGRGHLALKEYPEAIRDLGTAWQTGFQAPEVAYGLGLAMLKQFEDLEIQARIRGASPESKQKLQSDLVLPALQWMTQAAGASVDHPEYGAGLVAHAKRQFTDAEKHYERVLEQAPWLNEAWISRSNNEADSVVALESTNSSEQIHASVQKSLGFLRQAELIAPSDEEAYLQHAHLISGESISRAARTDRQIEPFLEARRLLEKGLLIRPDSERIRIFLPNTTLQLGFLMLSSGGNPAPLVRETATRIESMASRQAWSQETDWLNNKQTLHHLWWVVAEAEQRFGRDPEVALTHARTWRDQVAPDIHHTFTRLIEAKALIDRGQHPGKVYQAAVKELEQLSTSPALQDTAFFHSTFGQALYEQAVWEWRSHRGGQTTLARAIRHLEGNQIRNKQFAYTYYHLPRAMALMARMDLAQGKDPWSNVNVALASGKAGQAINPENAQLHLGAADAHLADGQARVAKGGDPTPAWAACRSALTTGERCNPRDYRLALLRAEMELAAAEESRNPIPHLRAAEEACRAGHALKRDEPQFRKILAQLNMLRTRKPIFSMPIVPASKVAGP